MWAKAGLQLRVSCFGVKKAIVQTLTCMSFFHTNDCNPTWPTPCACGHAVGQAPEVGQHGVTCLFPTASPAWMHPSTVIIRTQGRGLQLHTPSIPACLCQKWSVSPWRDPALWSQPRLPHCSDTAHVGCCLLAPSELPSATRRGGDALASFV